MGRQVSPICSWFARMRIIGGPTHHASLDGSASHQCSNSRGTSQIFFLFLLRLPYLQNFLIGGTRRTLLPFFLCGMDGCGFDRQAHVDWRMPSFEFFSGQKHVVVSSSCLHCVRSKLPCPVMRVFFNSLVAAQSSSGKHASSRQGKALHECFLSGFYLLSHFS